MEELLKDEKSQEILKQFIHQYIKDNLRLDVMQDQNNYVVIDVYLRGEHIQEVQS